MHVAQIAAIRVGCARMKLPSSWQHIVGGELAKPYFQSLAAFVENERREHRVFPPPDEVFAAFALTSYDATKVVLLGQDPYHDEGQAHGLCFSVRPPTRPPPSLVNMYKELAAEDPAWERPSHGCLEAWAKQGVLLLNAVLTVRAHTAASHKQRGWETFTDAVIAAVAQKTTPVLFVLWGAYAKKKRKIVEQNGRGGAPHIVLEGVHPSPLSAHNGFFGSRPFSAINRALVDAGHTPIDWRLS